MTSKNFKLSDLIRFDYTYYLEENKDLYKLSKNMNESDKIMFTLNHFIVHGQLEKRKYKFKNTQLLEAPVADKKEVKNTYSISKKIEEYRANCDQSAGYRDIQ